MSHGKLVLLKLPPNSYLKTEQLSTFLSYSISAHSSLKECCLPPCFQSHDPTLTDGCFLDLVIPNISKSYLKN